MSSILRARSFRYDEAEGVGGGGGGNDFKGGQFTSQ